MSVLDNGVGCACSDCSERIDESGDGYQIVRPDDISILSADVFCSLGCAKLALQREEREAAR